MKYKFYLIIAGLLIAASPLMSQATIELNVGDDLITTVAGAADGDTILIKQGLHKAQYETILLDKTVILKGEAGTDMPKLYIKQIDAQAEGIDVMLMNLDISGAGVDSLTGDENLDELTADYCVNLISGTAGTFGDIVIQSCIVRNFNKAIVRGDRDTYTVENFLFNDMVAYDYRGGSDYGPFRLKSKLTFGTFTLSNSTMYNFLNKIVDCQDVVSSPMDVTIENCTFNAMGGGKSGNYLFDIEDNDQATLVIRNCILGSTNQSELVLVNGFRVHADAYLEMTNSALTPDFQVTEGTYTATEFDKTEYNLEDFNPEWADPDNGDFTLPVDSDLLQWSPEGTIIGDPRWNPIVDGISRHAGETGFYMYPNPASDRIQIVSETVDFTVHIYNMLGKKVLSVYHFPGQAGVDISDLQPGIYFVKKEGLKNQAVKLVIK